MLPGNLMNADEPTEFQKCNITMCDALMTIQGRLTQREQQCSNDFQLVTCEVVTADIHGCAMPFEALDWPAPVPSRVECPTLRTWEIPSGSESLP